MPLQTYRQGDVLLIRVDPATVTPGKRIPRERGRIVLAHGEVTGHSHAIASRHASLRERVGDDDARAEALGARILKTRRAVTLSHEEHSPIRIPPGTWLVRIQREYSPGAFRSVAD